MKVPIKVSTIDQNTDIQTDFEGISYIDGCIGSIAFKNRPKAINY